MTVMAAPDATYQIELVAGAHTWTVKHTDPLAYNATSWVLDTFSISWGFPSGKPWPCQPEPAILSVALFAPDADALSDIRVGDALSAICYLTPGGPPTDRFAGFRGRVTDVDVDYAKHPQTGRYGPRFIITGVDHTADLAEVIIDPGPWVQELADTRLQHIADAITAAAVSLPFSPPIGLVGTFAALDVDNQPALGVILDHLDQLALDSGGFIGGESWARRHVIPEYDGTGALIDYGVATFWDRVDAFYLPATFALAGGVLGMTFPAAGFESLSTDAAHIPIAPVKWTRNKDRGVNYVVATGPAGVRTARRITYDPPVKLRLDSTLAIAGTATTAQPLMYLPDSDTEWVASGFQYDASRALVANSALSWTLDYEGLAWFALFAPVVIHGLPDELNLSGNAGIYAGQLNGAKLTIAGRRTVVDFTLRRTLPRSLIDGGAYVATWTWAKATYPTVTWKASANVVDPDITWYESRLIRRP